MQSLPQDFDYTRNSVDVLQRNTTVATEAADPQRFFLLVLVVVLVVVLILAVGFADGRFVVVLAVTRAAGRNVETGPAGIGFVQAFPYGGGMRNTWPG